MLMSALLVLTIVNNGVPTLKEALPVVVTLDIGCWVTDTNVKVLMHKHTHKHNRTAIELFSVKHFMLQTDWLN